MFWREMYSVEEAGNCLYFSFVFSVSRFLNELVIAMYTCVCLITVDIPKGDWKPLFNTLQMCLWKLWDKHGFTSFNYNCRWFLKLILRLCLIRFFFWSWERLLRLTPLALECLLNVFWSRNYLLEKRKKRLKGQ